MTIIEFRQELINVTLNALDKPFNEWVTFNDSLNTRIISEYYLNKYVKLLTNELPILECTLNKSYLLITTERIICSLNNMYDEVFLNYIECFSYGDDTLNYKKTDTGYPKISKITILKKNGHYMSFFVDSHYPFYFTNILIRNLYSYKKYNKWYLNSKKR